MGSKPVPHYANILMTNINKKIEALALPKIFLDDFILLYFRPSRKLHVLVDRKVALRRVSRQKKTKGPIFANTYDPRLPPMAQIQARHW